MMWGYEYVKLVVESQGGYLLSSNYKDIYFFHH